MIKSMIINILRSQRDTSHTRLGRNFSATRTVTAIKHCTQRTEKRAEQTEPTTLREHGQARYKPIRHQHKSNVTHSDPLVVDDLCDGEPLIRVCAQQTLDQIFCCKNTQNEVLIKWSIPNRLEQTSASITDQLEGDNENKNSPLDSSRLRTHLSSNISKCNISLDNCTHKLGLSSPLICM